MATVSNLNHLATNRTGAALLNLQATPMLAYPATGWVLIDSDPQRASGNIVDANSRTFFPDWPSDSVFKVRKAGANSSGILNKLRFRCRSRQRNYSMAGFRPEAEWAGNLIVGAGGGYEVNQSNIWTGGDDLAYSDCTTYENRYRGQVEDPPGSGNFRDSWDIVEWVWQFEYPSNAYVIVSSTVTYDSPTPNTTGNPFVGNNTTFSGEDFSDIYYYSTYSGTVLDYGEMIEDYSDEDVSYTDKDVYFSARADDQSSHGLEQHLYIPSGAGSVIAYKSQSGNSLLANSYTFKHVDTDQIYGWAVQVETEGRWVYTPDPIACQTCWFKDKVITIEVDFKQASVTHTNDPTGGSPGSATLGTWSAHSTQSFSLTLPDSLSATELGSTFTFPDEDGKVVAIADIRLVSIA